MRRAQVLFEEQQYEMLRNRARREGKSLSGLIRELVAVGLQASQRTEARGDHSLSSLKGLIDDPGFEAKDHDSILRR